MPTNNPNGRSWLGDKLLRLSDKFVSGSNYDPSTGKWNATLGQYVTGLGSKGIGLFNPAIGQVLGAAANGYYGQGPAARFFGNSGGSNDIGPVTRQPIGLVNPGINAGNLGFGGGISQPIQLPSVNVAGQPNLGSSNLLNGGQLGNWAYQGQGGNQGITYGNGAQAGTGYGAQVIHNDRWGDAAAGFGIGIGGASRPSSFAINDAIIQNKKNRV